MGQVGDTLSDVPEQDRSIDSVFHVRAGKFRRYHGEGIKQLFDFKTLFKNIRDGFYVLVGFWQSFWLLGRIRPDVIFTRGSFVSVPVCWAAALRRIPYVTHDSDAIPSLANRLIAPWASVHAVALPKEVYIKYPPERTVTMGVPISRHFRTLSSAEVKALRRDLNLNLEGKVLLATGGGHGAHRLNKALMMCAPDLLERYPELTILHLTGRSLEVGARQRYKQFLKPPEQKRVRVLGFVNNFYQYSGAADVVITRAGGSSMAELAALGKPCVVVPNPELAGGHQLENAKILADRKAVRLVTEDNLKDDPKALMPALVDLFDHPEQAVALGKKLGTLSQPNAAHLLANLVIEVAEGKKRVR